ncbi:hypothetical protein Unana1_08021 [Umbelopsis nana]
MQAQQLEGDAKLEPELPKTVRSDTSDTIPEYFEEPLDDMVPEWTAGSDFVSDNDFDMIDMLSLAIDQVTAQINERKEEFRTKSNEWKSKTTERLRSQTKKLEIKRSQLQQRLIKQYASINERMNRDTKTVQLRDKFSFVVGVGNACVSPVIVSRFPDWVPVYYTLQSALVFHSLDKVTSVFIHIFPALVTYVIRWMPELASTMSVPIMTAYRNKRFPALADESGMTLKESLMMSTVVYIIWQALYFVFIMVQRREKVEKGLRLTSYSWLLDDRNGKKNLIQRASFALGARYKLQMFMLLQLTYNIFTVIPTVLLYRHFKLHTAFLIIMFAVSVWNGASYYIEVFSRRYILEVEKKSAKKAASETELLNKLEDQHKQEDITEAKTDDHLKTI